MNQITQTALAGADWSRRHSPKCGDMVLELAPRPPGKRCSRITDCPSSAGSGLPHRGLMRRETAVRKPGCGGLPASPDRRETVVPVARLTPAGNGAGDVKSLDTED